MDSSHPLVRAVLENSLDLVRVHLNDRKVSLSTGIDFAGHTLLHLAVMNGFYDVAALLLRAGANVNDSSKLHKTPLHFACQQGSLDLVRLLVEHKSNPNAIDLFGMNPLHWYEK